MRSKLHQDITLWQKAGENEYGEETYQAPVLIMGRWEDRSEVIRTASGEEFTSKAVVFVPDIVKEGDLLAKGNQCLEVDASKVQSFEVRGISEIPSMRTASTERKAFL